MRPPEWTNDRHRRATTQPVGHSLFVCGRLRPHPAPAQAAEERDDLQAGQAGPGTKAGVFVFQLRRSPKKGGPRAAAAWQKRVCLSRPGNRLAWALARAGCLPGTDRPVFAAPAGRCGRGPVSSLERMAISVYARALSGGGLCSSRFCALLQLKLVLHDYGSGTFRSTA